MDFDTPAEHIKAGKTIRSMNNDKGFTLLELLLSFFIFSLIVGIIYSSYSGSFHTVNMTESRMEMHRKAAIAMDRISEDLQAAYISLLSADSTDKYSESTRFVGVNNEIDGSEADTISFFSKIPPLFIGDSQNTTGQLISYDVIQGDTEDELILLRSEHGEFADQADEREGLPLCDGLQEVKFTFVDGEEEDHEEWDSASEDFAGSLPSMVIVTLIFLNRENPDEPQVFETGIALPAQFLPELPDNQADDNNFTSTRRIGIKMISNSFSMNSQNLEEEI
jgi:prepilin-type N-terminal cleavage/methylation domain-containing protein